MIAIQSIEISADSNLERKGGVTCTPGPATEDASIISTSGRWRAHVRLTDARDREPLAREIAAGVASLVIGDANEAGVAAPPYVNAMVVQIDARADTIIATPSLTGLPPVFLFRQNGLVTLSSPFIPRVARGALEPDLDGVADTLRWGHPIDGRTLFSDLRAVLANAAVSVHSSGDVTAAPPASWPDATEFSTLTRREIVEEQVTAFSNAARRFTADGAFVSLSGGLDSRTSLVALLSQNHRPACITMAGSLANLDARLAEAVCKAAGLEHQIVLLDDSFTRRAPDLIMQTAALTGGVACLGQTADLFLYEQLAGRFSTRISGNLGNQVGRGGVESLSAYRPEATVFSSAVRARLDARAMAPWFIERLADDYGAVLFGQEVHFWSIPNYVVGSASARQLTPYADRHLVYLSRAAFTRDPQLQLPAWKALRARDLRHRLRGTPRALSFQREFLARNGAVTERVPLNWGWRAAGGGSPKWQARAIASAADAAMIKYSSKSGVSQPLAKWLGSKLGRRSALVDWPALVKGRLREIARDAFSSRSVRQAGIFDAGQLERVLDEHFSGKHDHHATVSRCLEIALGIMCRSTRA
jgi:hypothetical protein